MKCAVHFMKCTAHFMTHFTTSGHLGFLVNHIYFWYFFINSSFIAMDTYYDTDSQWKMDKFVSSEGTDRSKMLKTAIYVTCGIQFYFSVITRPKTRCLG